MEDPKPQKQTASKKLPLPVMLAIGCLGFLVLLGILVSVGVRILVSKPGMDFLKRNITSKTGVSVSTEQGKEGITYTDPKTGAKMAIGGEASIPADFPADFPVYPGAKPVGNLSGTQNGTRGFWLILATSDAVDTVLSYYNEQLTKNGWTVEEKMNIAGSATLTVAKGTLEGSLSVAADQEKKETSIVIILEEKK